MSAFIDIQCPHCGKKVSAKLKTNTTGGHSGYSCASCKIRFDADYTSDGGYRVKNVRPL